MRDSSMLRGAAVVTSPTRPADSTPWRVRWSGLAASGRSVVMPRLYQAGTCDWSPIIRTKHDASYRVKRALGWGVGAREMM